MVRSLLLLSILPVLALAHEGEHESSTLILPSNIEQWPSIINDLTSTVYPPPPTYPTGSASEPNPYPSSSVPASPPPSYGTGSAVPYPGTSGTSDQAPTPTETVYPTGTASEAPVAPTTLVPSGGYSPPPPAESSGVSGGNATETGAPAPTQVDSGANTFTVKLPIVLGALGLVFAML